MSRRALAPVDAVASTARSISEHSLSQRLAVVETGDELQRLSETFNQMMDRLESAFKRITQFTADASHELRTPTALIRAASEISLKQERSPEEYKDALAQILEEAQRMGILIDSLMTLARMDSGAESLDFAPIDVASIVFEAATSSQRLASTKQIQFDSAVTDLRLLVDGDALALRRLFLILIDNAIKYTPAGGRVSVRTESTPDTVVIQVADTGIGIFPEEIPGIFERFYRADKARSRESGAGLGLSIARWIVEAHHASIQVESTPGHGSRFEVRIPQHKPGQP